MKTLREVINTIAQGFILQVENLYVNDDNRTLRLHVKLPGVRKCLHCASDREFASFVRIPTDYDRYTISDDLKAERNELLREHRDDEVMEVWITKSSCDRVYRYDKYDGEVLTPYTEWDVTIRLAKEEPNE